MNSQDENRNPKPPAEGHGQPFTIWHRASKREPWKVVASGPTDASLTPKLVNLPSGDCITLPSGVHPDDRRS
jgi:hypothetical protein